MGRTLFSVGQLEVYWYGTIIAVSVVAALAISCWQARISRKSLVTVFELAIYSVLSCVIGARLYYVLSHWELYSANLLESLKLWRGGLAIHGAFLGLIAAFYFYAGRQRLSLKSWLDLFTPGIAFGLAVGQLASLMNQEGFGYPTSSKQGIYIDFAYRPPGYEQFDFFQPVFLYEAVWNLLLFVGLLVLSQIGRKGFSVRPGSIFLLYVLLYSAGHLVFDLLRLELETPFAANAVQAAVLVSVAWLVVRFSGGRAGSDI